MPWSNSGKKEDQSWLLKGVLHHREIGKFDKLRGKDHSIRC